MNLTDMYTASPDWLKLIWIVSPSLTAITLMGIWAYVRIKVLQAEGHFGGSKVDELAGEGEVPLQESQKGIT